MNRSYPLLALSLTLAVGAQAEPDGPASAVMRASCVAPVAGPLTPLLVTESVYQNEELAFDRQGGLVAKKGEALIAVPRLGPTRVISRDPALSTLSLGLRRAPTGDLIVAQPAVAEGLVARLLRVTAAGQVTDFFTAAQMPAGLPPFIIPNGLDVDSWGNAWVSDFATSQLFRVSANQTFTSLLVGPDATSVGAVVYDEQRGQLFFSSTTGVVRRLQVAPTGAAVGPAQVVASIPGARFDGLTLDACGALYVLDSDPSQGRFVLWRVALDGGGNAVSAPVRLAQFDDWVSGVQFGGGHGWDPASLYVSSIWGKVWQVRVGVTARRP